MSKSRALSKSEIKHALSICKLMTHSQGKRCALALSHSAMRVTEIALLRTKSIIHPSGKIREEVYLPAAICKGLKPRTIWITDKLIKQIIQDWVDCRLLKRWGTVIDGSQYQGLIPESRFLYSNRGRPYALTKKDRVMQNGSTKTYWASDALEHITRQIYKKAGLHGASSHSGRRSFVTNAINGGTATAEQVSTILGHSELQTTYGYMHFEDSKLAELYELAL